MNGVAALLLSCYSQLHAPGRTARLRSRTMPPPPPFTPLANASSLGHLPHDLHASTRRLSSCIRAQANTHSSLLIQITDLGVAKVAADGRRIKQQALQEHAAADCRLDGAAPTLTRRRHVDASSHADAAVDAVHPALLRVPDCGSLRCS